MVRRLPSLPKQTTAKRGGIIRPGTSTNLSQPSPSAASMSSNSSNPKRRRLVRGFTIVRDAEDANFTLDRVTSPIQPATNSYQSVTQDTNRLPMPTLKLEVVETTPKTLDVTSAAIPGLPVKPQKQRLSCPHQGCTRSYFSDTHLQRHIHNVHGTPDPASLLTCTWPGCGKSYWHNAAFLQLCRHVRSVHPLPDRVKERFPCIAYLCEEAFDNLGDTKAHMVEAHGGLSTYRCNHPGCGLRFATQDLLDGHHAVHVTCSHCGLVANDSDQLIDHLIFHGIGHWLRCTDSRCDWVFNIERYRQKHVACHGPDVVSEVPRSILMPFDTTRHMFTLHALLAEFSSQLPEKHRVAVQLFMNANRIDPDTLDRSPAPAYNQPRLIPPKQAASTWPSSGCARIDQMFDTFRRSEISMTGESERFLVKPAGKLDRSLLIVRLHYPNFHCARYHHDYLDMADQFNVSIAALFAKLETWDTNARDRILFQDLFSRRVPRSHGVHNISYGHKQNVVDAHSQFADDVWNACDAPFGLLLGQPVIEQYAKARGAGWTRDGLDGVVRANKYRREGNIRAEGPNLVLVQLQPQYATHIDASSFFVEYHGSGHARTVRRLVFTTWHPEAFKRTAHVQAPGFPVLSDKGSLIMLAQDRMIDVVAALALGRVPRQSLAVLYDQRPRPLYVRKTDSFGDDDVDGEDDSIDA